jgi:MFS family permease
MMQGLRQNRFQFYLLVLVNAFVGSMVGLERAVIPEFARQKFGIEVHAALLSFIMAFGISKALSNLSIVGLQNRFTRKNILILGWIFSLPVPFLLMYADSWTWVLLANVLLGINQGLAWSTTVIMKIDLVGSKNRGLAMGINEFAGYLSVGIASYLAVQLASQFGYVFYPFLPGLFISIAGLLISVFIVKDTTPFVMHESAASKLPKYLRLSQEVSWKHKNMGTVSINGLLNNMNDAVVWGLVPILLVQKNFSVMEMAAIIGLYPAVWGFSQLFTGRLGDSHCKKQIITAGMLLQGIAIIVFALSHHFAPLLSASLILGIGTALVYPNFLTVIAENAHPEQRAQALSLFRFWRDSGYVVGALLSGLIADIFGIEKSLIVVALLTMGGGVLAHFRMCCTLKKWWTSGECELIATY